MTPASTDRASQPSLGRAPTALRDHLPVLLVTIVAATTGVVVILGASGPSPTGAPVPDALLTGMLTAAVTWATAHAPWWALTVSGAAVAALAGNPLPLGSGVAAVVIGAVIGARALELTAWRAVAGAAVAYGSLGLDIPGPFGTESVAAAAIIALVAVPGVLRRTAPVRRRTALVALGIAGGALVATGSVGLAAANSRSALSEGDELVRRGLDALSTGDVPAAGTAFDGASSAFERAAGTLDQVWTRPAALVPGVAQHHRAGVTLTAAAATATHRLATTLAQIDLDAIRVAEGRIDLEAVTGLEPLLVELQETVEHLDETLARADDPWLVEPISRRLDDLRADIAERRDQGEVAIDVVRRAPGWLGADRPMRYLVAFVTPAEVRGSLGFMGNYAELTVDGGHIEMASFGRHTDLAEGGRATTGDPPTWRIEGMDEFVSRYGRMGFANREQGAASPQVWQIVTASPHFPSTAEVIAQLYPQSGGSPLDGVIALDPEVMAALIGFTGPVVTADLVAEFGEAGVEAIAELPEQIDSENAVEFLLFDQYLLFEDDNPDRIDALELLSIATVERLLAGALPGPTELGRVLGPLANDGHMAAWMADADAQGLIGELGLDRSLPDLDGADGVAVALNNGSGNKIEVFLDVDARYERRIDPDTGFLDGTLSVTFTNRAPAGGLPRYVIGNEVGLPLGWNRLMVALYAPFPYNAATLDGEPLEMSVDVEQGWHVMGRMIEIAPGASRTVEIVFRGTLDRFGADVEPAVMMPNLARRPTVEVVTEWVSAP